MNKMCGKQHFEGGGLQYLISCRVYYRVSSLLDTGTLIIVNTLLFEVVRYCIICMLYTDYPDVFWTNLCLYCR